MIGNLPNTIKKHSKAFSLVSDASNNLTVVSSGASILNDLVVINLSATVRYLHIFDSNVISPALEATTPKFIFPIPSSVDGAGFTIPFSKGVEFSTGIIICLVSSVPDIKTTIGAGEVILNLTYEN